VNGNFLSDGPFLGLPASAASMASGSGAAAGPAAHVGATAAITVEREPAAARLSELGVRSWPK
jgi:hypothetical protein